MPKVDQYKLSCEDAIAFVCEACWGFAELDTRGIFVWVNQSYCEILGAHPSQVLGTSYEQWTHHEDLQLDNQLATEVSTGAIPSYTLRKRYVQVGSTPVNPRIVWGLLSVSGKWTNGSFTGYRAQFQPYSNAQPSQFSLAQARKVAKWLLENWRIVTAVILFTSSLVFGGLERLNSVLREVKDVNDSFGSVLQP